MSEIDSMIGSGAPTPTLSPTPTVKTGGPGGLAPGTLGNGVVIMDGEAPINAVLRDSNALPIAILVVGGVFVMGGSAVGSLPNGGLPAAAIAAVGALIGLTCVVAIATAAAWLVAKIFGEDYGSAGTLLLRVGAINAAHTLAGLGLGMVLPGILVLLFGFPIFLVLAIWLLGMDMAQAFVFTLVVTIINVVIVSFVLMSFASMMLP